MQCTHLESKQQHFRPSVLVVDDLPANLFLIRAILEKLYNVVCANSGLEALVALSSASFDLVILDIMMPGMDGFETYKRMRKMPNFGHTPVVFLTALHDDEFQTEGLALGATDFITKPFVVEHVTQRLSNILQRSQLQKQLELALDSAELGLWELDICNNQLSISPRRGVRLDTPESAVPATEGLLWEQITHPASLPILNDALMAVLEGRSTVIDVDVKVRNREGEWVWVNVYGKPNARGSCGQVIHLMGTYRNIQSRKTIEAAKEYSEERLRLVMDATGEGVWDWDIASGVVSHNASWCRILGVEEYFLEHDVGYFKTLIHPDDQDNVDRALINSMHGNTPYASEHRLRKSDGSYLWVQDRGSVVKRDQDGTPLRMVGSIKDISAQKQAESTILQLAYYDFLTGLPNRRLLIDRLAQAIISNTRNGQMSAALFLDMDHFKALNDSHGHEAGDRLLKQVAERLKREIRECDTVSRLGGDEFVVLLNTLGTDPVTARQNAERVGENIRAALSEPYAIGDLRHTSTPSIGATIFGGRPHTVEDILRAADEAMYNAKAAGKNCLRFAADD